ncbi:MAG: methyltransferase domain-containing protein [Gammaproteobacteria bacterium]
MDQELSHQTVESSAWSLLRCPETRLPVSLVQEGERRCVAADEQHRYRVTASGIPLFAEHKLSAASLAQQKHYDAIAEQYNVNLGYPHTRVYTAYLDQQMQALLDTLSAGRALGRCVELCCGAGEAVQLLGQRMQLGVGVDISISMLERGRKKSPQDNLFFVQGDATSVPLVDECADYVFMFGGIHHVPNRQVLFNEVFRVLKPGGYFVFREPVSDFWLWRCIRALIYRISPLLDHDTERPLRFDETVPLLRNSGFQDEVTWRTYGFLGFCLFMNSDVLWFNRFFRFIPGISGLTAMATRVDHWCTRQTRLQRAGLQVVASVRKPLV